LIVLAAAQPGLFLGFGRYTYQLQRFFIAIEVIEQVAGQGARVDLVVLAPLPLLPTGIGRTYIAPHTSGRERSIKHVTHWSSLVDHHDFLGQL
jgi:hypothetical protein